MMSMYRSSSQDDFLDGKLRFNRFGKRSQGGGRRPNECLILEPSEMMVIDYPDMQLMHSGQRGPSTNSRSIDPLSISVANHRDISLRASSGIPCPLVAPPGGSMTPTEPPPIHYHAHPHLQQIHHDLPDLLRGGRSRGSVGSSFRDGSDTSSAYSGSDTMCRSVHSLDHEDPDLSGLQETAVDSDEEDLAENIESLSVQDTVRDCLEKDPSDRTDADIKILLEFTERLTAFSNMTLGVRRAMCQKMVFAVVDEADTVLMNDGEELDSWSVIINGHVEVTHPDGSVHKLYMGDSFGITPTMEKLYHCGVMVSKVDDCQFVCIKQSDYYRILQQGEENTRRHEEGGVTVLITEKSHIDACHREANIVIKGTPERLMQHLLVVENNLDTTYVEDFLLMHRKFIPNSVAVATKLLEWFEEPKYQDIVTRVFLRWVQSYFTDFEMEPAMMDCLERFEEGLQRKQMTGQLFFHRMVCMTKARPRTVALTRPSRDKPLQFKILGKRDYGIFVASVEKASKAKELGLKRADQILEVNGQSLLTASLTEAHETLNSACHLELTVRNNLHTYNEMLQSSENTYRGKARKVPELVRCPDGSTQAGPLDFVSTLNLNVALSPQFPPVKKEVKGPNVMTLKTHKLREFFNSLMTKSAHVVDPSASGFSDDSISSHSSAGGHLYRSRSNPDLSNTDFGDGTPKPEFPDHVLKVYRATDQSTRFLPVHKETTAREVVMLALSLFNIAEPSQNYALYEVSVAEGPANQPNIVKQKRLPDGLQNLAERIGLSSRYYLKSVTSSQNLCPDEVLTELIRESQLNLLQINSASQLAVQLTLDDFAVFRQIEPTEYVDSLFKLNSKYGTPALSKFEEISNKELYWVCTEVCQELNLHKRAKIVKQFIKIAKYCKDLNNFNSMFAIVSGLGSSSVNRLRATWSRVPSRYRKIYADLETVMDPSQNMKNYRKLALSSLTQAPMIPFYPIVRKDLLFLHEGNDDELDGLVNFEKLRTISKSIRKLSEMCSNKYCPNTMLEKLGQPQSTAMLALNAAVTGGAGQTATVKRRKKSTAQPDKKKMFEEAQMIRRVKSYLKQLRVITDEETLTRMSHECETPAGSSSSHAGGGSSSSTSSGVSSASSCGVGSSSHGGGSSSAPPSNAAQRRRHHSPTPSTASSTSAASHSSEGKKMHPRFGAASPTSERKILSLAESTKRPYHGPRPPTGSTGGPMSPSPTPSPGAPRRGGPPTASSSSGVPEEGSAPGSVHLNAESSSVTSLAAFCHSRRSNPLGSSVGGDISRGGSAMDGDSGISSQYEYGSTSSSGTGFESRFLQVSPLHKRRFSQQIPALPPTRGLRRPGASSAGSQVSVQAEFGPGVAPPRVQLASRTLSHDNVLPFYRHSRAQDEDDDAQVSAV